MRETPARLRETLVVGAGGGADHPHQQPGRAGRASHPARITEVALRAGETQDDIECAQGLRLPAPPSMLGPGPRAKLAAVLEGAIAQRSDKIPR